MPKKRVTAKLLRAGTQLVQVPMISIRHPRKKLERPVERTACYRITRNDPNDE